MRPAVLATVAWRSLVRSRVTFVLLVLAVAGGVGFQIPNTANLDGYTAELLRQGLGREVGHVQVTPRTGEVLEGSQALAERLRALPEVSAVAVRLTHAGVLVGRDRRMGARVVGIEPAVEEAATGFCSRIAHGSCLEVDGVVLGSKLADKLGVQAGDKVTVVLPYEDLGETALATWRLPVVGVLAGGGGFGVDETAYVPIAKLQALRESDDAATALSVFLVDAERIEAALAPLRVAAGDADVKPWWEVNTFVASAVEGNKTLAAISVAMSVLAVAIPALALFTIHVLRERRKIAVLSALGFGRAEVFVVYVIKAAILGALGVVPGIGVGAALCAWFGAHPIYANDGFVIRPELGLAAVLVPSAVIFGTTVVAGLFPAWLAARANTSLTLRDSG